LRTGDSTKNGALAKKREKMENFNHLKYRRRKRRGKFGERLGDGIAGLRKRRRGGSLKKSKHLARKETPGGGGWGGRARGHPKMAAVGERQKMKGEQERGEGVRAKG